MKLLTRFNLSAALSSKAKPLGEGKDPGENNDPSLFGQRAIGMTICEAGKEPLEIEGPMGNDNLNHAARKNWDDHKTGEAMKIRLSMLKFIMLPALVITVGALSWVGGMSYIQSRMQSQP